jgi:Raf kinase inhibitor-like YbhB/YbcL family protein
MQLHLTSSAFVNGGPIPAQYTCDGDDASPPLAWTGVPHGAKSPALIVDDPDAPDPNAPKRTWVHWVLYNLPPANGSLPTGVPPDQLPAGAKQGTNDWPRIGYGGPCPPIGRHRYFFKLFALDAVLPDLGTATKSKVESEMRGHILEKTELMGTYQRPKT